MDNKRFLLFIIITFLIVETWVFLFAPRKQPGEGAAQQTTSSSVELIAEGKRTSDTLEQLNNGPIRNAGTESTSRHPGEITTATMSKYSIALDHIGAVINSWEMLDAGSDSFRKVTAGQGMEMVRHIPQTVQYGGMLQVVPNKIGPQTWPMEIGLSEQGTRNYEDFNNVPWTIERRNDVLRAVSPEINGLKLVKEYTLTDEYTANLRITVQNMTSNTVQLYDGANRGLTLRWGPGLVERQLGAAGRKDEPTYDRTSYRMNNTVVSALPKADKEPIEAEGPIKWAAMESKFFSAIIMPEQPDDAAKQNKYFFRSLIPTNHQVPLKDFTPAMTLELSTARVDLPPNGSESFSYQVYVGPKKYGILKKAVKGGEMQSLMFHDSYGFMRAIYLFLTDILNWFYSLVKNYGLAVIMLTILVRLVVWPLTQKGMKIQQKSMAEMARVKPYIDEINEKYKDDPQEKQRRTWEVYKEHGISPFASLRGCLPMLLQLPVFFGLYRVCNDTIDLYGAQFLWIKDLSQADHLFHFGQNFPIEYLNILPLTMALTQFIATWISMRKSSNMDPMQKNMMYFMPLMFVFLLYNLPAGLMIYWNISNIWQIFQTMIINRIIEREQAEEALRPKTIPAAKTVSGTSAKGEQRFTKQGRQQKPNAKPGFWETFRKTMEQKVAEAEKMKAEAQKRKGSGKR